MDNIKFRASDLWEVVVKARLLQLYAVTKFPGAEAEAMYNRGQGMVDAMRQIFGKEVCSQVEKAVTTETALRFSQKYIPEFFDKETEDNRLNMADFAADTIEKMKEAASSFEKVRRDYILNATEMLKRLDKSDKEKNDPAPRRL